MVGLPYGHDEADRALVVVFAGPLSEARATGRTFDEVWSSAGASSDRDYVHSLAEEYIRLHQLTIEQLTGHFRGLRKEAEELLTRNRTALERVAEELKVRRELTHAEVEEIVRALA